ncbi:N-acetylmuramidase domain-containing protein [Mixta intestinalis]|uniref:N-acetylmuramidase domain-containing protein n=1 Tax=Mixta intestinalis TaxID=1615494 RepID=A0A6P1Q748_9GAMM|nr:N-acetylmuramidase family protein [Mixta intestinalis]QHM73899.1 hypothetical protein C7M51_04260 [Mixta intestinalis]
MARINESVGKGQRNLYGDVITVQTLLNKNSKITTPGTKLVVDGAIGQKTIARIIMFQKEVVKLLQPDGVISPNGITMRNLVLHSSFHTNMDNSPRANSISHDQYVKAARILSCEVAAIKAVVLSETPRGAFDEKGRPIILYERHYFHCLTKGKYDSNPKISHKSAGGYGKYSEQYIKLYEAIKLDKNAALRSASWGAFQIMGNNYKKAGHHNIESFIEAMNTIEGQLDAFINFILNTPSLKYALQNKQWATFAAIYNGPKYKENNYDVKMARNYRLALELNSY